MSLISPLPIIGIETDFFKSFIRSQFALPLYFCLVVLGCNVIALIPNPSSLGPASLIIILFVSQPALIFTVTGMFCAASTTA